MPSEGGRIEVPGRWSGQEMVRKQVLGSRTSLGHKSWAVGREPDHPPLTHSCPLRAQTASRLAMSPSPCSRRSTASGPSPRPSPRLPSMRRSPTRVSRIACPRPAVPSLGWTESWRAVTRRASPGANPPTGESPAFPLGRVSEPTPPAVWARAGRAVLVDKKHKAGFCVVLDNLIMCLVS